MNQEEVAVTNDVAEPYGRTQVEPRIMEVLQQVLKAAVALLGREVGFAVEVDVTKDTSELGLVGIFEAFEALLIRSPMSSLRAS